MFCFLIYLAALLLLCCYVCQPRGPRCDRFSIPRGSSLPWSEQDRFLRAFFGPFICVRIYRTDMCITWAVALEKDENDLIKDLSVHLR